MASIKVTPTTPMPSVSPLANGTISAQSPQTASPSPAPNVCAHCRAEITDSAFIRVSAFKFHKDHFLCTDCGANLHGQKFHQRDGLFYCSKDYSDKFLSTCRECGRKISGGKMISAFGHYYHPDCFHCKECSKPFEHGKYYERDNHPYCEQHGTQTVKCAACHRPVTDSDSKKANDQIYHSNCMACYHCGSLPSVGTQTYQREHKMYCSKDYLDLFCHRCTECANHIQRQCISVNDEFYHPQCLKCDYEHCEKLLDKYICISGHLRCGEHVDNDSASFECSLCHTVIDESVDPVRCVGMKLHPQCFVCHRCKAPCEKRTTALRDGKLTCQPCVLKEGIHYNEKKETVSASNDKHHLRVDTGKRRTNNGIDGSSDDSARVESKTPDSARVGRSNGRKSSANHHQPAPNQKIDWKKGELIGKGSFGKVYMGMNIGTGELIAVKQVRLNTTEELEQATAIQNEIALMENLRHPNIVAFLGTQRHGNKLNILMEFVPGKSLDFLLDKFGALYETVIRSYTKQLLLALQYCHNNGVVHRDIKGKNLLIDTKGNLKLADFGSAKKFVDVMSKDAPSLSYNYTPLWTAPEVLVGDYNSKVDIWSLGCVIIEMASAKPPWSEQNFENPFRALYHIGNSDAIPAIPPALSAVGQEFVRQCLTRDPDNRPTAAVMLKHPWIADLDINCIGHEAEGGEYNSDSEAEFQSGDDEEEEH